MKLAVVFPIMVSLSLFVQCSSQPPDFDEAEWLSRVKAVDPASLYAPHFNDDGTFFNPWMEREKRRMGSWRKSAREMQFDSILETQYAARPNDYTYLSDVGNNSISFVGHASMIIKMNEQTIFTDPFFSNAALIVRKKVKIKFDYSQVPQRSVVLLSHNHYDHLDKSTVKKLIKKDPVFVVPLGLKKIFTKWGAKEVHELDWWESVSIGEITYTLLPAQHWSRRIGQKGGSTLWGGFMIEGSKTIYFSGDSGYFVGFAEFGRRFKIDYAIVGVGAYEPRWFMHYAHLNVPEFFRAADDLGAEITIPMHLGVIKLGAEPVLFPLYEIDNYLEQQPEYAPKIRPLRVGEFLTME
jgi:L-ascorbate metabolism protein UlaG (beta-lactamase superfamily)